VRLAGVRTEPVEIGAAVAVIERQAGRIVRAGLAGDFFADDALDGLGPTLGEALGHEDEARLVRALEAIVVEGVRAPAATFARLLLAAATSTTGGA
jgi:hypothetical protein